MAKTLSPRTFPADKDAAETDGLRRGGTALAIYRYSPSCDPADGSSAKRGWGGARNRADRTSEYLTPSQVLRLVQASESAFRSGRPFQRHWIVHYGMAGITPSEGARFVGKLLDLVSKQARREGGQLSAIWVRERASGKGEHVHILMHLPAEMRLRGRTRRWVEAAGGNWIKGVSRVRLIGGRLYRGGQAGAAHTRNNAENVLRYVLKAADREAVERLRLTYPEQGGLIVGKRCGFTRNLKTVPRRSNCRKKLMI